MSVRNAMWRVLAHPALPQLVVIGFALLVAAEAEARVGGGQGFSSGRRSSGGGGGGGGGDGEILVDIFILLIHLCIDYPAIGIPLLILFVAGFAIRVMFFSGDRSHYAARDIGVETPWEPRGGGATGRAGMLEADPAFSEPVFLDFAGLVHRRALEASTTKRWGPLEPFATEAVRDALVAQFGVKRVRDVVLGSTRLVQLDARPDEHRAEVEFEANYTVGDGEGEQVYVKSRWAFRRAAGAISLAPDETMAMGCPSCGNPVETTPLGECTTCGTPITKGQLQWQATSVGILASRPVQPPQLSLFGGGDEPSVGMPTVQQSGLGARLRRFKGRHPEFEPDAFKQRVRDVYLALQAAWGRNRWDDARPYVTDPLFQQLRFWIEGYVKNGLRNQLEDVELHTVQIVKIDDDAWYESITVRIWGSMRDSTVDASGRVVAGNADKPRRFSEYWTFLRASGTGADTKPAGTCPSCGAPLDRIGSSGVCGYCDSKITTGRFDWVLSRIDQCDVYPG